MSDQAPPPAEPSDEEVLAQMRAERERHEPVACVDPRDVDLLATAMLIVSGRIRDQNGLRHWCRPHPAVARQMALATISALSIHAVTEVPREVAAAWPGQFNRLRLDIE